MGIFVKHEPCPECGSRDNLARYDDGSAWCFGCKYKEKPDRFIPRKLYEVDSNEDEEAPTLEAWWTSDMPPLAMKWLTKYHLTMEEVLRYGWLWDHKKTRLCFPYKQTDGRIGCIQFRYFSGNVKYLNKGEVSSVLPVFRGPSETRRIVLAEDALSAARIARQSDAMPLLGSYLSTDKLMALKRANYDSVDVWLDSNKYKEALQMSSMARWVGLKSNVIYTQLDPKEYPDDEIKVFLSKRLCQPVAAPCV
jgi:hypothetical protein